MFSGHDSHARLTSGGDAHTPSCTDIDDLIDQGAIVAINVVRLSVYCERKTIDSQYSPKETLRR